MPRETESDAALSAPARILLVEDHPIVRSGVAALLRLEKDLELCGVADDHDSALSKIQALRPDLVLMDVSLRGCDGMELLKEVHALWPELKVLMLSVQDESMFASRALRYGARGYIAKEEAPEQLVAGIRKVLAGDVQLSERMTRRLIRGRGWNARHVDPLESLSPRETQVFRLLGEGKTTRAIALELGVSVKTVETFREHIKDKLSLSNAAELTRYAMDISRSETEARRA